MQLRRNSTFLNIFFQLKIRNSLLILSKLSTFSRSIRLKNILLIFCRSVAHIDSTNFLSLQLNMLKISIRLRPPLQLQKKPLARGLQKMEPFSFLLRLHVTLTSISVISLLKVVEMNVKNSKFQEGLLVLLILNLGITFLSSKEESK